MVNNTRTYEIVTGDCLDLIAERFGVKKADLIKLNSDQIKDENMIFAGNSIIINDGSVKDRKALPLPPTSPPCGNKTCSCGKPTIVDILYVPGHPSTGKRAWYGLTEDAQTLIKAEQLSMEEAITSDKDETFDNLTNLGVLSKYSHKYHEQFLGKDDATHLRFLTVALKVIDCGASKKFTPKKGDEVRESGEIGYLLSIAGKENFTSSQHNKINVNKKIRAYYIKPVTPLDTNTLSTYYGKTAYSKEDIQKIIKKCEKSIKEAVIDGLKGRLDTLENKAKKAAAKQISTDGTTFLYSKKYSYYTSKEQDMISSCIKSVIKNRGWTDKSFTNKSHEDIKVKFSRLWDTDVPFWKGFYLDHSVRDGERHVHGRFFVFNLIKLNAFGYVVKEQCLSFAELVGESAAHLGPAVLNNSDDYKDWRSDKDLAISILDKDKIITPIFKSMPSNKEVKSKGDAEYIQNILESTNCPVSTWAYYPTLALIRLINTTLNEWIKDIKSLTTISIPDMFSETIWIKQVALARIAQLKSKAEVAAASKGKNILNFCAKGSVPPASFKLLWDEAQFKPAKMQIGQFKNQTKKADIEVVECSLLSEGGKVGWVRGPCWYLPKDKAHNKSNGHVVNLTDSPVPTEATAANNQMGNKLHAIATPLGDDITKNPALAQVVSTFKTFDSKPYWSNEYHWQDGMTDGKSTYNVNGEAQFLRFSTKVEGKGSANLDWWKDGLISPSINLSSSKNVSATLALASGSLTFETWLPKDADADQHKPPSSGINLLIPYVARDADGKKGDHIYDGGSFHAKVAVSVSGSAAASLQLSGELSVGPSATDGGVGVKGKAFTPLSYNQDPDAIKSVEYSKKSNGPATVPMGIAAQTSFKGDCFAGVEAAGSVSLAVYWKPPVVKGYRDEGFLLVGQTGYQVSASFGIGASGEFTLSLQNGELHVVLAGKVVCGGGVGGKFSFKVEMLTAERLVSHLLALLSESGFMYIQAFGDIDENGGNPVFEYLNLRLTMAVALGLSITEVLLLPAVAIDWFEKDGLQEKYGLMIAKHINKTEIKGKNKTEIKGKNKKEFKGKNKAWLLHLPPEALAKLLNCLLNKEDKDWIESEGEKQDRVAHELEKAEAVSRILTWIATVPEIDAETLARNQKEKGMDYQTQACCAQFEKTMFLMGAEAYSSDEAKWMQFADSWEMLEGFILNIQIKSDDTAKIDSYNDSLKRINGACEILGQNIQGYRHRYNTRKYIAHRKLTKNSTATISKEVNSFIAEHNIINGFEEFKLWKIKNENT